MVGSENSLSMPVARRRMLASAAGMLAAAVPADALAASSPDAELIELCNAFDVIERRLKEMFRNYANSPEEEEERDSLADPLVYEQQGLLNSICRIHATSLAGYKARAKTLRLWLPEAVDAADEGQCWAERMSAALVRDLAGEA